MNLLEPFVTTSSADGQLALTWNPQPTSGRAFLIISLRPLELADEPSFVAGKLDNDLIRMPVDLALGGVVASVPAGRTISVGVVITAPDRALHPGPPLRIGEAPDPRTLLEAPVTHDHTPSPETPFVFAGRGPHPDLEAMARRIRSDGDAPDMPPLPSRDGGCFGARQRWYLTRLRFDASETGELAIVRRAVPFGEAELRAWEDAPPEDADRVSTNHDGLIDGITPDETSAFFAVLRGPAPWRPLRLMPSQPPFTDVANPVVLGDPRPRLVETITRLLARTTEETTALSDLPPLFTLMRAAAASFVATSPELQRVIKAVTIAEQTALGVG